MGALIPVSALRGKKVYFDTNLFIYAVEPSDISHPYLSVLDALFGMVEQGEMRVMTSELSLAETLVGAYKHDPELVVIYEELFTDRDDLAVYPVDKAVLRGAAYARSVVKLSLADAIHVATAIAEQADYFISNDDKLRVPEGIQKIRLSDIVVAM